MMSTSAQNVRTVCPYCGVGCGMILQVVNDRVVKVLGDKQHPANFGRLCTKGFTSAEPLTSPGRLAFAQTREKRTDHWKQISMTVALEQVTARLQKVISQHGPDAVALYVSGQLSMESQYLANKLAKGFLRSNNIDSNSRLCMSSAASGYKLSLGADGPPGSYQDIDRLDCALVIGSNMADCHPILFLRLLDRRKQGAKIIVVDPRRTATADKADLFLQIKPGTDLALLNGLLHLLEKDGRVDQDFILQHTEGWAELCVLLKEYSPARVAEITGLREADICKAAKWIGEAPEFTTLWTMGLNQSTHGTWHTNAICNLHLATGKICRPGSGPFSLTGQPNAMGGREVGYLSHGLPGQRSVNSAADRAFVEELWGVPPGTIRSEPGLDAVALFQKLKSGEAKAVWIIGTNPVASMPNRRRVIEGLEQADLVIVQDAFQPTETSAYADILLPGALWAEAEGTMVNSERNVTLMPAAVTPPGEALPDWLILTRVAQMLGFEKAFPYARAGEVFDEIRRSVNPRTGYDLRGMDYEKLRQSPRQWPMGPSAEHGDPIRYLAGGPLSEKTPTRLGNDKDNDGFPLTPALSLGEREKRSQLSGKSVAEFSSAIPDSKRNFQWLFPLPEGEGQGEGKANVASKDKQPSAETSLTKLPSLQIHFPTPSGRAHFFARPYLSPAEWPDADFPFTLTNGRLAHQWHTLTKTGKVASLNKLNPGPFVELHPEDAAQLGVKNDDLVKVNSRRGFAIYPAVVTPRMSPGTCFAPIHWNDVFGENLCINAATNDACDVTSLQPEFKFTAVALTRVLIGSPEGFTREQKRMLHELLSGFARNYHLNGAGVPTLPAAAPFTARQHQHINELLARLCAGDSRIEKQP